jgi:hypothetical protein
LCVVDLPELPVADNDNDKHFGPAAWQLYASTSGTFCAIVVDKGRKGIVVDTSSSRITMVLDGGDYYEYTVPLSACFLRVDDRDVFVFRTAWNRLDAADPATGQSLTERSIGLDEDTGERPPHYLDYFHGRLWPSPDGNRLLDDGWIWHPVSVPRIWSVADWIRLNPWESEDGASVVQLAVRDDWNTPACWVSDHRVAIWSVIGRVEEHFEERGKRSGVEFSDATSKDRSSDEQWAIDIDELPHGLFSDGQRLFIAGETSTTVWEIASHSRLFALPDFSARLYDAKRETLVAVGDAMLIELSLP